MFVYWLSINILSRTRRWKRKDTKEIYVRLRGDKPVLESEIYQPILNETSVGISGSEDAVQGGEKTAKTGGEGINVVHKHEEETKKRQVFSCLTQGNFTFLPCVEVTPFAMENSDRLMYISVQDGSRSWCSRWDMQVNPQHYSCVTIKEDETSHISVFPSNPVPRWIQNNKGDASFLSDAVKVHQRSDNVVVYMYLAKVNYNPDVLVQLVAAAPLGLGPSGTYGYPVSHWGLDRKWKVVQDEKTGSCSTRDRQVCCSRTIVGEKI